PPQPPGPTAKIRSKPDLSPGPPANKQPASAVLRRSRRVQPPRLCGRCASGGLFGIRVYAVHEINTDPEQTPSTLGSCWVTCPCLDSGRFCGYARLLPYHLPRVPQIIYILGHRSVGSVVQRMSPQSCSARWSGGWG